MWHDEPTLEKQANVASYACMHSSSTEASLVDGSFSYSSTYVVASNSWLDSEHFLRVKDKVVLHLVDVPKIRK